MIVQVKNVNATQLNSGTAFAFDVKKEVVRMDNQNYYYTARTVKVKNTSGASLYFLPMTDKEYEKYEIDSSITDLIPLASDEELTLNELQGNVVKTVIQGSTGHSSSVDFIFLKKRY